jgi:large subunit ribosomal protein L10
LIAGAHWAQYPAEVKTYRKEYITALKTVFGSLCQFVEGKDFFLKGGEFSVAFTKKRKSEMIDQYQSWYKQSQAIILLEYGKMSMKDIDNLRTKAREAGGQVHVTKNTLLKLVLDQAGIQSGNLMEGATLCGFAFTDAPAFAKALTDAIKGSETFKFKGGFLDGKALSNREVVALAEMPPLPVMRARLLGMLQAPAGKLVRTIAEPGRQIASVVKAYSEKDAAPAA